MGRRWMTEVRRSTGSLQDVAPAQMEIIGDQRQVELGRKTCLAVMSGK